jgi:ribosomal protein S18 acetylase RimI-like enzyme
MSCRFTVIEKININRIKELWQKLNEIHLNDSNYFKEHYKTFTFEKRCEKFNDLSEECIRIEVIEDKEKIIGYCISTIEKRVGEIDSLYVEEKYRKYGYGSKLVENAIGWLKQNKCEKIIVSVAEGHESVISFYMKHRFYPRMTYLQMKE